MHTAYAPRFRNIGCDPSRERPPVGPQAPGFGCSPEARFTAGRANGLCRSRQADASLPIRGPRGRPALDCGPPRHQTRRSHPADHGGAACVRDQRSSVRLSPGSWRDDHRLSDKSRGSAAQRTDTTICGIAAGLAPPGRHHTWSRGASPIRKPPPRSRGRRETVRAARPL